MDHMEGSDSPIVPITDNCHQSVAKQDTRTQQGRISPLPLGFACFMGNGSGRSARDRRRCPDAHPLAVCRRSYESGHDHLDDCRYRQVASCCAAELGSEPEIRTWKALCRCAYCTPFYSTITLKAGNVESVITLIIDANNLSRTIQQFNCKTQKDVQTVLLPA